MNETEQEEVEVRHYADLVEDEDWGQMKPSEGDGPLRGRSFYRWLAKQAVKVVGVLALIEVLAVLLFTVYTIGHISLNYAVPITKVVHYGAGVVFKSVVQEPILARSVDSAMTGRIWDTGVVLSYVGAGLITVIVATVRDRQ